nr:flagellar basal body rod C-terminal domain-containing protein [Clostridium polynesiense]
MGRNSPGGNIEPIHVGNGTIKSDSNNNIFVNGRLSYSFNTADFQDYNSLRKIGDNLYQGENPVNANVNVKQGFIEKSNVNVVNEMINMMTVMRHFETNQKMVQIIDETLNKAANEVGSVR